MAKISSLLTDGIRKYGVNTITRGDSNVVHDFPRIPTGIFALDYATGGGIPVRVTSSIYGPPGGGKSLVCQKTIANAQKLCFRCFKYEWDCDCGDGPDKREVAIVCTEMMDLDWAKVLGIDIDKLVVVEPEYGEQAGDIIIELLRADDCGLVVLDSIAMMTPLAELQGSMEDAQVASQARLLSKLIRKIKATLIAQKKRKHEVCFLTTNQIRTKIGQLFGNPEEVPGGFCSKHDWHLSLRMSQLKSDDKDAATDLVINGKFKASMAAMGNKRKLFTMAGAAEFFVTLGEGGEFQRGTVADYTTVEKFGKQIDFFDGWNALDRKFKTKKEMIEAFMNDEQFYLSVKKGLVDEFKGMAKMEMGL